MLARASCQTDGVSDRRERLSRARLYLVCEEHTDAFLEAALSGGVDVVQLRCKGASSERILAVALRYGAVCERHGALLILNDRPELVAAAGADGAHVGQDDVPVARARELVGRERILGLSTHTPEQVTRADVGRLDYIGVGPVYSTPTKPGRAPVGLELVRHAAEHAPLPFFAIGGIDEGNVGLVAAAGASRVAVVRALTRSEDPERAARALRGALAAREEPVGTA